MGFIHTIGLFLVTIAVTTYGVLWSIPSEDAYELIFGKKLAIDDDHLRFAFNLIGAYMLSIGFMGFSVLLAGSRLEKRLALRVSSVLVGLVIYVGFTHKPLFVEWQWNVNMGFNSFVFLLTFLGGFVYEPEEDENTNKKTKQPQRPKHS